MTEHTNAEILVYIGTWANGRDEGIHVYRMDPSSGALTFVSRATETGKPFFLAIDAQQRRLYAANTVETFEGQPGGSVGAFAIDPATGNLAYMNQQSAAGALPCYVSIDRTGRHILAGNYSSGSLTVLPIQDDGSLGPATDTVRHEGSGANPQRQEGPHVHSIVLDPASRYAFAADLGIDKLMVYRLDASRGKLIPGDPPWVQLKPGAGPRHFTFHPNGRYAYVINELDNTIVAFGYDGAHGRLTEIQTISTLPAGFTDTSYCADIQIYPSGKVLYATNRGHNSIAIFGIDEATGRLTPAGHTPVQGDFPWNLAIDPTDTFLLVANTRSDQVVVFRIDPQTGQLVSTGHTASVPNPVCIKMILKAGGR